MSHGSEYVFCGTQDGKVLAYHGDHDNAVFGMDSKTNDSVRALAVTQDGKSIVMATAGELMFYKK